MAIDFDIGDSLIRTTGIPASGTPVTCCLWYRPDVLTRYAPMMVVSQNTSNYLWFGHIYDGTDLSIDASGTSFSKTHGMSVGNWYFLAFSVDGTGDADSGRIIVDDSLTTGTPGGSWTGSTDFEIGADPWDLSIVGRIAAYKVWNAELSLAEIEAERYSVMPKRWGDLIVWLPPDRTLSWDMSGTADFTEVGTPTLAPDPPLGWGAPIMNIGVPGVAGGGGDKVGRLIDGGLVNAGLIGGRVA